MSEIKARIIVAVIALLLFNWPLVEFFSDQLLGYLFTAWLAVIVASFILFKLPWKKDPETMK